MSKQDVKKLSIKTVCNLSTTDLKAASDSDNQKLAIFTGEAQGYGTVQTQYGESRFITGILFAQNMQTGEIFQSRKAFLPNDITDEIVAQLDGRKETFDTVEFGVEISVTPSEKSGYGYEYVSQPIKTPDVIEKEKKFTQRFLQIENKN